MGAYSFKIALQKTVTVRKGSKKLLVFPYPVDPMQNDEAKRQANLIGCASQDGIVIEVHNEEDFIYSKESFKLVTFNPYVGLSKDPNVVKGPEYAVRLYLTKRTTNPYQINPERKGMNITWLGYRSQYTGTLVIKPRTPRTNMTFKLDTYIIDTILYINGEVSIVITR